MRCLPSFLRKLASAFYCDFPAKLPFFSSTAWGCRPKTPLAAPLAGKMSQGYALLTEFSSQSFRTAFEFSCGKLARLLETCGFFVKTYKIFSNWFARSVFGQNLRSCCSALSVFGQNLLSFCSLGAFSGEIRAHVAPLGVFWTKFVLTLRRPTRFGMIFIFDEK